MKNLIRKFCLDKKFNNICLTCLELLLLIYSLITKSYGLLIWSCLGIAICNIIIKKVYSLHLMRKLQKTNIFDNIIIDKNNKEDK